MSPGQLDPALVRRHLAALADLDEAWALERGLHLCEPHLERSGT